MATSIPNSIPKIRLPKVFILQQSTKIWLSICLIIVTGAWRHLHTTVEPNAFQEEVWVEWLSWIILFAAYSVFSPSAPPDEADHATRQGFWHSPLALWLSAATFLSSQLLSSQSFPAWVVPLTTIAVTYVSAHISRADNPELEVQEKDQSSFLPLTSQSLPTALSLSITSIAVILNVFCIFALMLYSGVLTDPPILLQGLTFFLLRTTAVFCMIRIQNAGSSDQGQEQEQGLLSESGKRLFLSQVSIPMASLLTLILIVKRPELSISSAQIFGQAFSQAIWWYSFVSLIELQIPITAVGLDTTSLSVAMALVYSTDAYGIATALAVLMASLLQMIYVVRANVKARQAVFVFILGFILVLWALSRSQTVQTSGELSAVSGHFTNGHPIENVIAEQRAYFERLQARQSKTVDEAVKEYQRRFGRRPPLGFDKWFELAQEHNFVLPDEFDTFMQSLEPFNGIHPSIIQQRMDNVYNQKDEPPVNIGRFGFENGNLTFDANHNMADGAQANFAIPEFTKLIPYNFSMLWNVWDEAMVNSPWAEVEKAIKDARNETSERFVGTGELTYTTPMVESTQQNGWAATRQGCRFDSPARQNVCHARKYKDPLEFIKNVSHSTNVCQNCEIRDEHGILLSTTHLFAVHELTPIWSTSKPSHFNDIVCPSYWYHQNDVYEADKDKKWEDKKSVFFWAGSSTGGWATKDVWERMQRQRLVLDTSKRPHKPIQLLEREGPNSNSWSPSFTSMGEIADLFHTRITAIVQADSEAMTLQEAAFQSRANGKATKEEGYSNRFAIDIDGNAFSGRFYRLLKSNSVVVKSTMLREWHDDRLIPWVHYVPLSLDFHELPEMARFLAKSDEGLKLSERIAQESTEWYDKALRKVDLQLAFLRMMLEYGRVMNPHLTY